MQAEGHAAKTLDKSVIFDRQVRIRDWQQEKIENATALCLGTGGLGTNVAVALCRLGVKKIILVDYDVVEVHNLNRQFLFSVNDVGEKKVEAAKKNLALHNVAGTIIETFHGCALSNWSKIIEFAKESDVVFNMIDWGDHFDMAVQSLCLALKKPLILGGTFSSSLTVDYIKPEGKPCLKCQTDDVKKEIIDKILPSEILKFDNIKDLIPKNQNPIGQSNYFLCSTCANFMVSQFVSNLFGDPDVKNKSRVIAYVNTFESIVFESPVERKCPFCVTEEDRIRWEEEDKKKAEEEAKKKAELDEEEKKKAASESKVNENHQGSEHDTKSNEDIKMELEKTQ